MFELSTGNDGIERGFVWLNHFVNQHGLANGMALSLENDWNTNSYKLYTIPFVSGFPKTENMKLLEKVAGEVISKKEFEEKYKKICELRKE